MHLTCGALHLSYMRRWAFIGSLRDGRRGNYSRRERAIPFLLRSGRPLHSS